MTIIRSGDLSILPGRAFVLPGFYLNYQQGRFQRLRLFVCVFIQYNPVFLLTITLKRQPIHS